MTYIIALINLVALAVLIRKGLPRPFPWLASAFLGWVLLMSAFAFPALKIERAVGFVTLLSSMVVAAHFKPAHVTRFFEVLAVLLIAFMTVDAFRMVPTPDIAFTPGETFEWIRRPYLLEHPNVKAAWLLLLTLSPITLTGIFIAQSRGALMGYLVACVRFVPRKYYAAAAVTGVMLIATAAFIRPGSFFGRVDIWADGVRIFLDHPLVGAGTGSFRSLTSTGMSTAHNVFITIAAENGVLGLAAFIAWLVALVPLVVKSASPYKFHLLAFTVQQLVDDQWLHPVTAILLGAVMAVTLFPREDM
jgi:hypothetical protein